MTLDFHVERRGIGGVNVPDKEDLVGRPSGEAGNTHPSPLSEPCLPAPTCWLASFALRSVAWQGTSASGGAPSHSVAALARHPHALARDAAVQRAATPVLLEERVEGVDERAHDVPRVGSASSGDNVQSWIQAGVRSAIHSGGC